MKKLICVADIEALITENKRECFIPRQRIITPAAKDLADEHQIQFVEEAPPSANFELDDLVAKLFSDQTILKELIALLENQPYEAEEDESGFKLIRGDSIHYQTDQEEPGLSHQLLFNAFGSLQLECIKLKQGTTLQGLANEEIHFVIVGKVITKIEAKEFESRTGDSHYYPAQLNRSLRALEDSQLLVIKRA